MIVTDLIENEHNLYQVQDADRPMYVIARNWQGALELWRRQIRKENDMRDDEECEPMGISLVADYHDILM
jgi:hypothetical protein